MEIKGNGVGFDEAADEERLRKHGEMTCGGFPPASSMRLAKYAQCQCFRGDNMTCLNSVFIKAIFLFIFELLFLCLREQTVVWCCPCDDASGLLLRYSSLIQSSRSIDGSTTA